MVVVAGGEGQRYRMVGNADCPYLSPAKYKRVIPRRTNNNNNIYSGVVPGQLTSRS